MCVECDAVALRRAAASGLLDACQERFGVGPMLKAAFPVDHRIPEELRRFLDKL